MEEIIVKVDVPLKFEKEFKLALAKLIKEFTDRLEFELAKEIVSKSMFTEKDADELSEKIKILHA